MDLQNLSAEEAIEKGIVTLGAWNDKNWEVDNMPSWRKALEIADKYHTMAKSMYTDKSKELRAGTREPYIKFIQDVISILIREAHIENDTVLTVAALYNITSITTCSRPVIEQEFGAETAEMVQILRQTPEESFGDYIGRCMGQRNAETLVNIVLAVKLHEERVTDRCPFESWEEDIPYYKHLVEQIKPYVEGDFKERKWDRAVFLGRKLLEQIDKNMTLSWNMNKTAEELYEGWNDNNSKPLI